MISISADYKPSPSPWTARRSNQSILKEINPEYSLEGLMLKMKLQSFGHLMRRTDSMEETLMLGKLEGIGSVGLLILELYNLLKQPSTPTIAQWLYGFLMILLNISENQMVFRAGLVDGDHVTLEHHSYFFWLLLLFFTEGFKPSHLSHQQLSCQCLNTRSALSKDYFKVSELLGLGLMSHFYDMFHAI